MARVHCAPGRILLSGENSTRKYKYFSATQYAPSSFIINAGVTSVIWRSPRQNAKLHEFVLQKTLIFLRGRTIMAKLNGLVVVMAVLVSTAWGQSLVPKSEFTGGYTYGSMDQNVRLGSTGRLNANRWNTGAPAFLNNALGNEVNVAG